MFDAPAANKPGPQGGDEFAPRYSPYRPPAPAQPTEPEAAEKYTGTNNPLLPPVVTKNDPAIAKTAPRFSVANPPPPGRKPETPAKTTAHRAPEPPKAAPAARVEQKPAPVPAPAPEPKEAAAPQKDGRMPAARVTSEGVVTGPKTMPSVPAGAVTAENVFDTPAMPEEPEPTLMARHQQQQQPQDAAEPASPSPPQQAEESASGQSAQQSLPFEKGVTGVENPPLDALIATLRARPDTRLIIEAYASPVDDGENSDKRIALARGLNLRKHIIEQGIDSHRIDVRALGRQSQQKPLDRVDLKAYKPQKTAD